MFTLPIQNLEKCNSKKQTDPQLDHQLSKGISPDIV